MPVLFLVQFVAKARLLPAPAVILNQLWQQKNPSQNLLDLDSMENKLYMNQQMTAHWQNFQFFSSQLPVLALPGVLVFLQGSVEFCMYGVVQLALHYSYKSKLKAPLGLHWHAVLVWRDQSFLGHCRCSRGLRLYGCHSRASF